MVCDKKERNTKWVDGELDWEVVIEREEREKVTECEMKTH